MKLLIFFSVIATIVATGDCIVCYQCVFGERTDELQNYSSCNKFLDNRTCNTTSPSTCVTYISNYLHRKTIVHDCWKEERPLKHGEYETIICKTNYCNRDENWGRYNGVSSVTLETSLALVLIAALHFLQ